MVKRQMENVRLDAENGKVFVSNLEIGIQDAMNKTVVLADDDDETPRNVDRVETNKLLIESDGGWEFVVFLSMIDDFSSREEFDEWAMKKNSRKNEEEIVKEMSFEQALNELGLDIFINKNYYSDHREELEKDLNRKVNDSESLTDNRLKKELLYKLLCKLFGANGPTKTSNEYDFILEDFHIIDNYYGCSTATAKRGEYFLKFVYYSS